MQVRLNFSLTRILPVNRPNVQRQAISECEDAVSDVHRTGLKERVRFSLWPRGDCQTLLRGHTILSMQNSVK